MSAGLVEGPQNVSLTYYHQYALSLNYSLEGGANGTGPSVSGVQFGQTVNLELKPSGILPFFDSGTNVTIPLILAGSNSSVRWATTQFLPSGEIQVAGAARVDLVYQLQYHVETYSGPEGGGSITELDGWFNTSSSVQLSAAPSTGWECEGWAGTGTGSYSGSTCQTSIRINGPIVENATFYPGLTITVGSGGAVEYGHGAQSGVVGSGSTATLFAPAGTAITLNASPSSLLYQFSRWSPSALGTSAQGTMVLDAPTTVNASFSLNIVLIGSILGAAVAAIVVVDFAVRGRSRQRTSTFVQPVPGP